MFGTVKNILFVLLIWAIPVFATAQIVQDSLLREYNFRIPAVLKNYSAIKQKISADFPKVDSKTFSLADSAMAYAQDDIFDYDKRLVYANCLVRFMNVIYDNATNEEVAKGKFNDAFKFFPIIIEWDRKNVLQENLQLYRRFALPFSALIPNDKIAEAFIVGYSKENPSEVLRYAAQFGQRSFAPVLIDSIAVVAPDLVKKYLTTDNVVSSNMVRSTMPVSKFMLSVYRTYGQRSLAFLLAYNVLKKRMTLAQADSIGNKPAELFKLLVSTMSNPDAFSRHSIYQYLENYSLEQVRNVNSISVNGSGYVVSEYFKTLEAEHLFAIMVYGHREATLQSLSNLVSATKRKIYVPFSYKFISSINTVRLRQFLAFAERNGRLDAILQMMDGKSVNYLYSLMSQDEVPDLEPDLSITDSMGIQALLKSRVSETEMARRQNRNPATETDTDPRPTQTPKLEDVKVEVVPDAEKQIAAVEAVKSVEITKLDVEEDVVVPPIQLSLTEQERQLISLKKNISATISDISKFVNEPFAKEVLIYAATVEPDDIFKRFEQFKTKYFATEVLETAGRNSPTSLKRYIYNNTHPIYALLEKSNDSVIQAVLKMPRVTGYQSKAYVLMDAIVKNRLTVSQAENICNSPQCMFKELATICTQREYIGKYSVERELTDFSLRFLREINDNIAYNEPSAFNAVETFTPNEIYFLMVFGREEVVTSSFNGLYDRLRQKMRGENIAVLLKNVSHNRFRTFVSMCANYGKLEAMLADLPPNERDLLLVNFVSNINAVESNAEGVEIAETLQNIHHADLLKVLHTEIKRQFIKAEKDNNKTATALYGVLASLVDGNAVTDKAWFRKLSQQIKIPAVTSLSSTVLMGAQDKCVAQMYFYNDPDGRDSYNNFINTYKVLPNWKIEDRSSFVVVKSVEGNAVEILANKPEYETNGQEAVADYMRKANALPSILIHRGHSFHTASTMHHVKSNVKLLIVGSCGGFYKLAEAIDNAPEAHIIATKQIGTKTVNDPILLAVSESIRNGRNIVWKDFWDGMKQKLGNNPHFTDYIPPHQNLKSVFSKAYFSLLGV